MLAVFVMAAKTKFSVKSFANLPSPSSLFYKPPPPPPTYRRATSPTHSPYFHVTNFSLKRPLPWPLVNFGCPHLRLIDSSLPAGVKLSNLTHEGAWKRRGVNAHKTCSWGKHRRELLSLLPNRVSRGSRFPRPNDDKYAPSMSVRIICSAKCMYCPGTYREWIISMSVYSPLDL